jgi:VWFA-related protein
MPDLTAADFELLTDGKPQKVTAAEFRNSHPLRIALMVDDLSLSPDNMALAKLALHDFVARLLQPGDEALILATSASEGSSAQFTSDRAALGRGIDALACHCPAVDSPQTFSAGSLSALRAALLGLQFTPGRKLAIFLSERLRDRDRANQPTWSSRLLTAANRSGAVLYGVDVASSASASYMLAQGLAGVAPQTGGAFFDAAGAPGPVLARIAEAQQGYYLLRFDTDPLQHLEPIAVKIGRAGVEWRGRSGPFGLADETGGAGFLSPEDQLQGALATILAGTGIPLDLQVAVNAPDLEALLHIDAREVTLTLQPDGIYHGSLVAAVEIFQDGDRGVRHTGREFALQVPPERRAAFLKEGIDVALGLANPPKGPYQMHAAVMDETGGRVGAASRFFEATDAAPPTLTLSPIELARVVPPGQATPYRYDLGHLRRDYRNHALVEVTTQLTRDGKVIYTGKPQRLDVTVGVGADTAHLAGTVSLGEAVEPGKYRLTIGVTDLLASGPSRRTATGSADFEVRR